MGGDAGFGYGNGRLLGATPAVPHGDRAGVLAGRPRERARTRSVSNGGGVSSLLADITAGGSGGAAPLRTLAELDDEGGGISIGGGGGGGGSVGQKSSSRDLAAIHTAEYASPVPTPCDAAHDTPGAERDREASAAQSPDASAAVASASAVSGAGGAAVSGASSSASTAARAQTSPAFATPSESRGAKSVEAHVEDRASRAMRLRARATIGGRCGSFVFAVWAAGHAVLIAIAAIATFAILLGVLLRYVAPDASFGYNPAFKWLFLFGVTGGSYVPLAAAEWALFAAADAFAAASGRWAAEAVDFMSSAKYRIAPIAVVVMALLLKSVRIRRVLWGACQP